MLINTVEGLWSQIKRLNNNFSGLNINNIINKFPTDTDKINYLDGWIAYSLFLREIEMKKIAWYERKVKLCHYLSIDY